MLLKKKSIPNNKTGLIGNAIDYSQLNVNSLKKVIWYLAGFTVTAVVSFIFYESLIFSFITGLIGGTVYLPIRKKQEIRKRQQQLKLQFKELLEAIATSLGAGKNVSDAFYSAKTDLSVQFPQDADIVCEVELIINGLNNNLNIENLLADFGDRSGLEEIKTFASVFKTCYRKGGNIKEIIKNTTTIINDKIDIEMEIDTLVAGKKSEQKIMLVMPIIFVFAIKTLGGELIDLHSSIGIISVTISIGIFTLAYFISKKILNIKL